MTIADLDSNSSISYAHSSDFNHLFYTPISSKKLPKWWFSNVYPECAASYHTPNEKSSPNEAQSPDVYPNYTASYHTTTEKSSPHKAQSLMRDVIPLQDNLCILYLLIIC